LGNDAVAIIFGIDGTSHARPSRAKVVDFQLSCFQPNEKDEKARRVEH
jgi:hypothetical protein